MPHLERLVEQVHESSSVSVLDGEEVVYVARVPTKRIMRIAIAVGTRFPAHATSMGRVLLAGQADEWLDGYLATVTLSRITSRTITDAKRLRTELNRIRRNGYALVDQELEEGLRSVAAPIHATAIESTVSCPSYSCVVRSTGSRRIAGHGGKYMNVFPSCTKPSMPRLPWGTSMCPSIRRRAWRS